MNKTTKGGIAATAVAAMIGGGLLLTNQGSGPEAPRKSQETASTGWGTTTKPNPPVEAPVWARGEFSGQAKDLGSAQTKAALAAAKGTKAEQRATVTLMAESAGFTSDLSKANDPKGGLNPLFSYWTHDLFTSESAAVVEQILNPAYGNWGKFQAVGAPQPTQAETGALFSDRLYGAKGKDRFPIMRDYAGSGAVESTGGLWFGKVDKELSSSWVWDQSLLGYKVTNRYAVTYTANTASGGTVALSGVLTLVLTPTPQAVAESGGLRVQVDGGSLKLDS